MTDRAEADLAEIWAYVASDGSAAAATRLLDRIEAAASRLLDFPFAGSPREQLGEGLHVVFQGKYAVYYRPSETEIVVIPGVAWGTGHCGSGRAR